ncbi:Glycosyltransferase involved in cell wall bisynthesis [Flavobacterium sp. CF108]|uniref:glycosyltransferase family 4 protein n=1 Tax=unclassified Flavobacterium TaxID=196869 RepID=UPI0008D2D20C|nr:MULTISPECIES: glycosyltransferase family 1 protein [unclassified Flavobacterium]SEN68742.1 Glycosyltransferase involved in cell wall bisynthesis [Flavobacterium sp. fv08]SHH08367.1 Glycosyltransferase involved in cell wall bisynthesis [Flavobacterium sp. CF108]
MRNKIVVNGRFLTQKVTGVQRVATEISKNLQEHYSEEIVFLCPNKPFLNPVSESLNCKKIGCFSGYFWEQVELPLFLFRNKVFLLINFCNTAPILFKKNVIVVHDMAVKENKDWFSWKFAFVYNIFFYFNLKKALKIITVSNFSKNEILKFYPNVEPSKIDVVYLASLFSSNEEANQKGDYFIAVNSLNPRKNIKVILEAFKVLDLHQFKLKIIGDSFNNVFNNDLLESDSLNVEFLNDISDVELKKEMKGAKALINGSFYEGFGLSALEAMSVSTPCILSNIPVYKELYNETALFFDPGKPLELVQKIKDLIDLENYTDLCKRSFELSQKFNWETTSQRYISIIENLKKNKTT